MNRSKATLLAAAWVCAGLTAATATAEPPMLPAGKTFEAADSVYVIPDGGVPLVPNVGIVVGEEGVLVIDTGMGPANAEIILSEVREITSLPVRYLVTTHFHPEHNFGAQSFPAETLLLYPIAQHRDLQNKGEEYRSWFIEMFGDDVRELLEPVELVEPDLTFERQVRVDLGNLPVHVFWFGHSAHTGGDTVVYLPRQKLAFVGGLAPNHLFPILADADSSVLGWLATLEPLSALDAEIIVPDHGKVGGPDLIETVREYLTAIQAESRELKRRGVPLESAQDTLHAEFSERYPDWGEDHWIRNAVERAYAEAN
ncbi:MAG: MBL fold metallo-hydrolase [Woeseia sp.]